MSLSIDVHNAVAATVLQSRAAAGATGSTDQSATDDPDATSAIASSTVSPAYTIATTASAGSTAAGSALTGVRDDLDGDGARLMALQVKQSLTGYAGSIANQSSQALLSLFRN